MAADMHVHSAPSLDNAFAPQKRVRTFVAEHGEIMVAAEHDTVFDFNPILRDMGLTDKMVAITGTEGDQHPANRAGAPFYRSYEFFSANAETASSQARAAQS